MQPTYSFLEIKNLIRSLDVSSIKILEELIEEEKECFAVYELKAFSRFIQLMNKNLIQNQLQLEYLLSFN